MNNLYFKPLEFINNLWVMGVGLVGIFLIIGIIMAATYAIGKLPMKSADNDAQK